MPRVDVTLRGAPPSSVDQTVAVQTTAVSVSAPPPAVSTGLVVPVSAVSRAVLTPAATLQVGSTATVAALARGVVVPAPSMSTGRRVNPAAVARAAVIPVPSVQTSGAGALDQMVVGMTVLPYPHVPGQTQSQAITMHNSIFGQTGCYRSYSGSGQAWPTTWNGLTGNHPRVGDWQHNWSWHSLKPNPQALASGAQYTNIRNFIASIPITGYKRLITFWHESDVGSKIPNNMSFSECKQMLYEVGRAIRDENHPDVLYGPIFGSHFTLSKVDQIMAATWSGETVSSSTALLRTVFDFIGWDPYNLASQNGDYSASKQGLTGAHFYLDQLTDWTSTNFPDARFAIAEFGYRPLLSDLTLRPEFIDAYLQVCDEANCLVACYFDCVVATGKENWLPIVSNPRGSTTYDSDNPTIANWSAKYDAYPAYAV